LVKQNLFDGVLDSNSETNYVDFSTKGRSQFIEELEAFINGLEQETNEAFPSDNIPEEVVEQEKDLVTDFETEYLEDEKEDKRQLPIPFEGEARDKPQATVTETPTEQKTAPVELESKAVELEQVMNNGMQFLAGLFKMSTGKDLGMDGQQIKVNKETGEVTMTFKLPM